MLIERSALSRWRDNLGEAVEVNLLPGFAKGMAAAVVKEAVRRVDLEAHRLRLSIREIRGLISHGERIILVDQNQWRADEFACHSMPFVERDGQYWGPPLDDADAIREFERLRQLGARFIVFGWQAFWWLDHYTEFARYLRERFHCVLENDRLVAFDVRSNSEEGWARKRNESYLDSLRGTNSGNRVNPSHNNTTESPPRAVFLFWIAVNFLIEPFHSAVVEFKPAARAEVDFRC